LVFLALLACESRVMYNNDKYEGKSISKSQMVVKNKKN
jgi:hypothetical protein